MKTLTWAIKLRSCSEPDGKSSGKDKPKPWFLPVACRWWALRENAKPATRRAEQGTRGPHAQGWPKRHGHARTCVTCVGHSVVYISLWPHGLQPTRLLAHGILQARILEWVAIPFSRGSSRPRDQTQVSCIAGRFFTDWATREALDVSWNYSNSSATGSH